MQAWISNAPMPKSQQPQRTHLSNLVDNPRAVLYRGHSRRSCTGAKSTGVTVFGTWLTQCSYLSSSYKENRRFNRWALRKQWARFVVFQNHVKRPNQQDATFYRIYVKIGVHISFGVEYSSAIQTHSKRKLAVHGQ